MPLPKPSKDSSQGPSYRPISLLCPTAKVLEVLILPSINKFLSPAKDLQTQTLDYICSTPARNRHRDRLQPAETTTPYGVVCVAIDLTAAFDTVSHDTLISKIAGSFMLPAINTRLSCYLRGKQAATSFRGTKSSTRIFRTGVPQGSKLSPSLFNYYIADMPRSTPRSRGFATLTTSQSGLLDQRFHSWSP